MNKYSELSDFEINKAVAESIGLHVSGDKSSTNSEVYCGFDKDGCKYGWGFIDYCNNPSDAWPIIVSGRIGINFVNGGWRAQSMMNGWVEFHHENPLRSAMIVYLMMKDGENA